jgi:RNA polymerase sigma-70 factor (ECF subfamily)
LDDEHGLLSRAKALDEAALAQIFDTYYPVLYRYFYYHTAHMQTAEDLAAQVFQRLLARLHAGTGPDRNVKAWLFRVAQNLLVDDARRFTHRNHAPLDEDAPDDQYPVEEQTQSMLLREQMQSLLMELTPQQREVIILRFLMDMTSVETAEVLKTTVGATKALQNRALSLLRRKLAEGTKE